MAQRLSKLTQIQDLIAKSSRLSKMPSDSRLLAKLDEGVKSLLGGKLPEHCQIGKIEDNILIYYVDSPIWAYTFRMSKTNIITTLNALGHQYSQGGSPNSEFAILSSIVDIHIRVRPSIARPQKHRKKQKPLPKFSAEVGKSIEETADTLEDLELAELWRNFGRNHSEHSL